MWIGFCIGDGIGKSDDDFLVVFWLGILVDVLYWWNVENVWRKRCRLYLGDVFGFCCGLFGDVGRDCWVKLWGFFWCWWEKIWIYFGV